MIDLKNALIRPSLYVLSYLVSSMIFAFTALALDCPEGTYEVEVSLASLGKNLAFCQKSHQGSVVKHGPEESRDLDGKLIETKFYDLGTETKNPPAISKFNSVGLPGIAEKQQKFVENMAGAGDHRKVASEKFQSLLQGLLPFFNKSLPGTFMVRNCPDYSKQWGAHLLFRQPLSLSYKFVDGCDIKGTVSTNGVPPEKGILFNLDLRSSEPFNHVKMHVKCMTTPAEQSRDLKVTCVTDDAVLSAMGRGETECKADYAAFVNPMVKGFVAQNLGGTIEFRKIFGVAETYKTEFKLPDVNGNR